MKRRLGIALALALIGVPFAASQHLPAATTQPASDDPTIHYKGPAVTAPELLPFDAPITPPTKCKKLNGTVKVFIVVDELGKPRQVYLLDALGNDLDLMALHLAELSNFKPGIADGARAMVAVADEMKLQACNVEEKDQGGQRQTHIVLREVPAQRIELTEKPAPPAVMPPPKVPPKDKEPLPSGVYRVGGGVYAPRILKAAEAEYSDQARAKHINGTCRFSVIVDEHGIPRDPVLEQSVEPSLDLNAAQALLRFRFTPAMKNGEPVPVRLEIEVSFKIW